jgi:hypothetical protein
MAQYPRRSEAGMRSKGNNPTKAQKRWMDQVASLGSIISGKFPVEMHHCVGFTGKHNKILIGPWWILPLTESEHKYVHLAADRKDREKRLFVQVKAKWVEQFYPLEMPVPDEVQDAIMEYHR